jgi:YidC/Oxa1 family membrane protein insertase
MGFTMWAQMRMNPTPPDPVQARMFALMPFIFTFMLAHNTVGLVIYWAWNNTLSIAQQRYIMRKLDKANKARDAKSAAAQVDAKSDTKAIEKPKDPKPKDSKKA